MSSTDRSPARIGIAERTDAKGQTHYRGTAYDKRAKRHLKGPWTRSLAAARSWRVDALSKLQAGTLSANSGPLLRDGVAEFLEGIEDGAIRTRSGRRYKPSTVTGYRRDLLGPVVEAFGSVRLARITLPDVQLFADALLTERSPSRVHAIVTALQALYGWALPRGSASVN